MDDRSRPLRVSGYSANQKTTARLTFDKSASLAGFFPNGTDRLIEPIIGGGAAAPRIISRLEAVADIDDSDVVEALGTQQRIPARSGLHPFVQGLIDALPAPESTWTIESRAKWLQAAANNFDLMYKGSGVITISAKADRAEDAKE